MTASNEIPKFHETFGPILEILSMGEMIHTRDLKRLLIEKYYSHLPQELLSATTKTGDILIENRIGWGKSYLKKGGYIHYPQRGFVQITEKGAQNKLKLTLRDIEESSSLSEFYTEEVGKRLPKGKEKNQLDSASPQDLIELGITRIESEVKGELLNNLKQIDPYFFEKVILILLKRMGYGEFTETSKSADGGIDGIINEDKLGLDKIYIQAKRFNENKVREKDIRNFIGAMSGDTNKGVFVTTSLFDIGAIEKAKSAHHKIILIDGVKLVALMHEYNVGVQVVQNYEVKQLDVDFFEEQ